MKRRNLVKAAAAAVAVGAIPRRGAFAVSEPALIRVRPSDPAWPSDADWERLNQATGGRLSKLQSPLTACREAPDGAACRDLFRTLKNPFAIGDDPALTQTTGWVDAWTSRPSAYVVAAETAADVAAAVAFARDNNLRLVVRGGAHSYLGTSTAPDSLLIWTRRMNAITLHDAFVPQGCPVAPDHAVSVGAGVIWGHAYNAVTTKGGRYVQGGGCLTVGVPGLVLGGGFGNYSRQYGTAAASLLEAEVVTADGAIRIANACSNPDLYWALKGGGGGSFGAVTRLTLRTHALPGRVGIAQTSVQASTGDALRRLLGVFIGFYADALHNRHWTQVVTVRARRLDLDMEFQGIDQTRAEAIWRPFLDRIAASPDDFSIVRPPVIRDTVARNRWDPAFFRANAPAAILSDDRPGAPEDNIYWSGNGPEAGHFLHGFESAWLPVSLLRQNQQARLADALFAASRLWPVELHFHKGVAGGPEDALAATRDTATNPAALDAFVLAIIASESPPAFPGLPGHEPNLVNARLDAGRIARSMAALKKAAPDAASYVAESSYFEPNWQQSYWGTNYPRLLAIKQKYDPGGLFFARHGVGSEAWSEDGFIRVAKP